MDRDAPTAERPAQHILSAACTMLGITTTLIGLVKILESQTVASRVDELAGFVGILFLVSAMASYGSIRLARRPALSLRLERFADLVFFTGLSALGLIALFFGYEMI